jgi:hypothetical protein
MTKLKNSIIAIVITMLFLISATTAPIMIPKVSAQSTSLPTYSLLNVAPNPCGIGQTVTLNMFLAVPLIDSEDAVNITITVTNPAGTTSTLGPFTTDTTGGTYTTYIPSATGNYTFQMYYGGQTLTGAGYVGYIEQPSSSATTTLVVTNTPATFLPNTPLPTEWWQTPVNAENVQNWAPITGPWLGLASSTFASTGMYNALVTGTHTL